ncbi:MAG: tetratricopeptide repeat-containing sensor histidine kinase, partial [Chitinophagaceae bacterium]
GELLLLQGNYSQSYDYYLRAKQWAAKYLTPCEIGDYSYNLGMVLYRQQKYTESAGSFKESFDQYGSCSRAIAYKQQEVAGNIGLCYVKTRQYDSALAYFNKALAVVEQTHDPLPLYMREMAQAVAWGNLGKVYVARNSLDTAATLFKKSLAINGGKGYDKPDAQLVQAQLAEVYGRQNRYADMFTLLQQLKTGLDTMANPAATLSWNRLMAAYYKHAGQPLKEFRHYQAFITMRDSATHAENVLSQEDISRQVRDREQQLEIALLKKSNQLNKTYLLITVSLSVIALLVIAFIYYIFRKTARLNRLISVQKGELEQQKGALEQQKEELEQLNHVKNRLFSIISHDMRSPVNSLSSFIYLLEEGDISKASLLEYSYPLKKSLASTSAMMENLLSWAASQLQGFRPSVKSVAIREITATAIANTAGSAEEKGITVINDISPDIHAAADKYMLQVVLRNLLGNAIKYSHPAGVVTVGAGHTGTDVTIKVKDTGIGMTADQVSKINAATHLQVLQDTMGTAGEKGVGLGVYLCATFIEMMKGTLQVESEPGKGTVFFVRLPA